VRPLPVGGAATGLTVAIPRLRLPLLQLPCLLRQLTISIISALLPHLSLSVTLTNQTAMLLVNLPTAKSVSACLVLGMSLYVTGYADMPKHYFVHLIFV